MYITAELKSYWLSCYLQHPSSHNFLIPRMLSIYYSCLRFGHQISSLTNFNLAWKTASLLVFVTDKHSDLSLFYIDNQHHFLLCHSAILFLHLVVRWIDWITFHLKFILNLSPMLIFALYFI